MHRLVIDDCRVMEFPQDHGHHDYQLVHARTNAAAMEWLDSFYSWDEVWFDYDMGMVYGKLETAYESTILPTLDYILELCFNSRAPNIGICVIHTANPTGRQQLETALSRYFPVRHTDARQHTVEIIDWSKSDEAKLPPTDSGITGDRV